MVLCEKHLAEFAVEIIGDRASVLAAIVRVTSRESERITIGNAAVQRTQEPPRAGGRAFLRQ